MTSLTRTPKNRVYCLSPGTPNMSLYLQSPNMSYEDIIFHGGGCVGTNIDLCNIFHDIEKNKTRDETMNFMKYNKTKKCQNNDDI